MRATITVSIKQQRNGAWRGSLKATGKALQTFSYATEEEAKERLAMALRTATEFMCDGVVTSISALTEKGRKVSHG